MRTLLFLLSLLLTVTCQAQLAPQPPSIAARAWLLLDYGWNQTLASENADTRIEPASLTKLMTAYLAFTALKQGKIQASQTVPVSERAWKVQGSRMFIEPKRPVTVDELLHGMIVQSGNDACIALAEIISGSEEAFVQMMNNEAKRLGLTNTHFANSTGLPDPQHYSTARDLAWLTAALIRDYPEYYPLYSLKEYSYNRITQPNRNRLLWLDPHVDGVKTGHTETAGFCLIASAKRGPRRLVAVVLGTDTDGARAQESQKLLNFGFQNYDAVRLYDANQAISQLRVFKGAQSSVKAGFVNNFILSVPQGQAGQIKVQLISQQPLVAPVSLGSRVGTLKLTLGDKPYGEFAVVALETVPIAGIIGRAWDTLWLWFQ